MYLQFDTETTDKPDWKNPSEGDAQPHIVELAAVLFDSSGAELGSMNRIVKPDGWVSGPEALAVHGITHEQAMDEGVPEHDVVEEFMQMSDRCKLRSAHVVTFDNRILRIALKRFGGPSFFTQQMRDEMADAFRARRSFCTANASTKILMLPPTEAMQANAKGFKYKTPDLAEAWAHFFPGEPFPGGRHRAMGDVVAGKGVFLKLLGMGLVPDPDQPLPARTFSRRADAKPVADGPAEVEL